MISRGLTVLFFYSLALWTFCKGQDCAWDKDVDFPLVSPPLLLDASLQMVYPVLEGTLRMVRVPLGSTLTIACSGITIALLGLEAVEGTCAGDKLITIEGVDYSLSELGCLDDVSESIQRDLGTCGDGGVGTFHAIGFSIATTGAFFEAIRVCFEPVAETTIYTEHTIHGANILAKDTSPNNPSFKTSTGFFTVSMSTIYTQDSQLALMEMLLGDAALANQTIDPSQELYMARGKITPVADNVLAAEQDATFYYINAVPHWQVINNANWKFMAMDIRDLAANHSTDMTIYTGNFGVMELNNVNGSLVQIYLGLTEGKEVVPAPDLTWKVVYEDSSKRAVGLVSMNDPFIDVPPTPLCNDVCSSLTWIIVDNADLSNGYTYCCNYADLRAAIPDIPDLGDVGLLDS